MKRPSLDEIYERVRGDLQVSGLRYSFRQVLAKAITGAAHLLYGYMDGLSTGLLPDSASGPALERWADIWGLLRREAAFAEGTLSVASTAKVQLPRGTVWRHESGLRYESLEAAWVDARASVRVRCLSPGPGGNLGQGEPLLIAQTTAGLVSAAEVVSIAGGVAAETDESLRERLLARLRRPPQGGAPHDYIAWAQEVPGVTRAWVLPRHEGRGTVAVTFAMDAADGPIPDLVRTVPEVKAHLEAVAPATASVSVQAPRPKELHLVLELTPSTEEVRHQVEQEVADLLLRKATPKGYYDGDGRLMDGTVRESDLHAAISSAPLELAHRIISPAGDVSVENIGDIIVLGSIRCA